MPNDDIFDPNAEAEKIEKAAEKAPQVKPKTAQVKTKGAADKSTKTPKAPAVKTKTPVDTTPLSINDDVPLPSNTAGRKSNFDPERLPFAKLEVGQSFFAPVTDGKLPEGITAKTVMQQVKKLFDGTGKVFIMRELTEGEVEGARFWRKK